MSGPISDALATVYAGYIEDFQVNLFERQLSFSVVHHRGNDVTRQQLVFDRVSAFYFANGPEEWRFNFVAWERAEISEIYYFENPINHMECLSEKKGIPRYHADPNFYLEIWDCPLFIEAQAIILDGVRYEVSR